MSASPTILLVDDEKHTLRLLEYNFSRKSPFRTLTSTSGRDAIELCKNENVSAIVIDYQMPELNGVETVREIRRIPGRESLPILVLSARGHQSIEDDAEDLMITRFLTKPFSPTELISTLKELL